MKPIPDGRSTKHRGIETKWKGTLDKVDLEMSFFSITLVSSISNGERHHIRLQVSHSSMERRHDLL
jgi:LEA14-like dessication related protein